MSKPGTIYAMRAGDGPYVKIGYAGSLQRRLNNLQIGCPEDLRVIWTTPGTVADEKLLHHRFESRRRRGEWFDFAGMSDAEVVGALNGDVTVPEPDESCLSPALRFEHGRGSRSRTRTPDIILSPPWTQLEGEALARWAPGGFCG